MDRPISAIGSANSDPARAWNVNLHAFRAAKGPLNYFEAVRRSKDPPSFMVLFEDSAALDMADIAISANGDAERFAAFGLPVLPDGDFQDQGPLAGILAGLLQTPEITVNSLHHQGIARLAPGLLASRGTTVVVGGTGVVTGGGATVAA